MRICAWVGFMMPNNIFLLHNKFTQYSDVIVRERERVCVFFMFVRVFHYFLFSFLRFLSPLFVPLFGSTMSFWIFAMRKNVLFIYYDDGGDSDSRNSHDFCHHYYCLWAVVQDFALGCQFFRICYNIWCKLKVIISSALTRTILVFSSLFVVIYATNFYGRGFNFIWE